MTVLDTPLVRAARRVALVAGVGALGAAVCSVGVGAVSPGDGTGIVVRSVAAPQPARPLGPGERRALELLRRAVTADRTVAYSGTKWLSSQASGGAVTVVEVRHDPQRGSWFHLTTPVRDAAAPSGTVPDAEVADLDGEALRALGHHYALAVRGPAHCAGRTVTVVEARRLGTERVAGRFWLDRTTGLLLRRELYDGAGSIVRATTFVQVDSGAAAARVPARSSTTAEVARPEVLADADLGRLRRSGWVLPDALPGGLERYRGTRMTVAGRSVVQLAFSDGLFTASLFVEQGRVDAGSLAGFRPETLGGTTVQVRTGLHRTLVWNGPTTVYTLVLDVPETLAPDLVAALPHTPVDDGLLARMNRGVARVGSWVNPFD